MISLLLFFVSFACFSGDILAPSVWRHEGVDDGCRSSWSMPEPAEFDLKKLEISYTDTCDFLEVENTRGQTIVCLINRQEVLSVCDVFLIKAKTDQHFGSGSVQVTSTGDFVTSGLGGIRSKQFSCCPTGQVNDVCYDVHSRYLNVWKFFGKWDDGDDCAVRITIAYDNFSKVPVSYGFRGDKASWLLVGRPIDQLDFVL